MPKREGWQKGEGPYSKSDDLKLTQGRDSDKDKDKDISAIVEKNSDQGDGFDVVAYTSTFKKGKS